MSMMVTRLEQVNKRKCRVYLNDEPAFLLFYHEIEEYHIQEGQELSNALCQELADQILGKRAKVRCMDLLQISDKTEQELVRKLHQEEYPETVIREALDYVKSYHYVDDFRYARNYIDSRKDGKSRQQISYELLGKGIRSELIGQAWEEAEPVDPVVLILRWAKKRHYDPQCNDERERRKFYQFLLRKGFLFSDIKKALT